MQKSVIKVVQVCLGILIAIWFVAFAAMNLSARVINNSDVAQTGICARAMWEAKSLRPETFIPWSESGIFSLALIGAPIYGMTNSIWLAQVIPPIIMSGLIVIAVEYFLRGLDISKTKRGIFLLLMLCFPVSFYPQSMVFLFYAAYSQCVLSFFWITGDYVRLVEGKLKHVGIHIAVQLAIAALQGINSSRGVLMVYAPLVMTEALRCGILWLQDRKIRLKDLKIFSFCAGLCIVSYGMTYLPWSVKKEVSVDVSNVTDKITQLILPRLLSWLGITGNTHIFLWLIIIVAVILSCVMGVVCLFRLRKMEKCDLALVFFWCSFLLTMVMRNILMQMA